MLIRQMPIAIMVPARVFKQAWGTGVLGLGTAGVGNVAAIVMRGWRGVAAFYTTSSPFYKQGGVLGTGVA